MSTTSFASLTDAFVNCTRDRPLDSSALGRVAFWRDQLGRHAVLEISPDHVDAALIELQTRGRLKPKAGFNSRDVKGRAFERTGQPLKGSTVNRYLSTLGEIFKAARRLRLVPRAHLSPLAGLERAPEPVDPARYFRPEEVERLIKLARVLDRHWRRLAALIHIAFVTGLRVGTLQSLTWSQIDLEERLVSVGKTKNGDPITAVLTAACVEDLKRLARSSDPAELVFRGRRGNRAHNFRKLWALVCVEAGLPGRNFHQVRHGTGSYLAAKNVNQAGIMAVMGHRTLAASRRYMHHNTDDKRAITARVFGE